MRLHSCLDLSSCQHSARLRTLARASDIGIAVGPVACRLCFGLVLYCPESVLAGSQPSCICTEST